MFTISEKQSNGFSLVVLEELSSKTYVEIIPGCGGILHSFNVWQKNAFVNVIDNYASKQDFDMHVAEAGFKSCKLSPFACRINKATYRFEENTYTTGKFFLGENSLHGLLYNVPFSITYLYADEEHAGVAVEYQYRSDDAGFPFDYDCVITYHLKKNNELQVSTDIFNRGQGLMPLQDGWHPYFALGGKVDDWLLQFKCEKKLQFDEHLIPTGRIVPYSAFNEFRQIGEQRFDDCFILNLNASHPLVALQNPVAQIQVDINPDKSYPYLQLYTPAHRNSIAIENLSAPSDCFNNGINLIILPPDANMVFSTRYRIRTL